MSAPAPELLERYETNGFKFPDRDYYDRHVVFDHVVRMEDATQRERFDPYVGVRDGLYILDPRFDIPQWVIYAEAVASIRVQLYKVGPRDYFAFEAYEQGTRATPPGRRVLDKTYEVNLRGPVFWSQQAWTQPGMLLCIGVQWAFTIGGGALALWLFRRRYLSG